MSKEKEVYVVNKSDFESGKSLTLYRSDSPHAPQGEDRHEITVESSDSNDLMEELKNLYPDREFLME